MRYFMVISVVAVLGVLWIGGEWHRSNCIDERRVSCSVLPWDAGEPRPTRALTPLELQKKYSQSLTEKWAGR